MYYAINKQTKEHRISAGHATPEEYIVNADADGWILWHGGECPLPDGEKCEVKYRKYGTAIGEALNPCDNLEQSFWEDSGVGNGYDIVAYRPILEEAKPTQWRGPEDGLPPVGTECEFLDCGVYYMAKVIALTTSGRAVVEWFCAYGEEVSLCSDSDRFRPIRNHDQVAEERAVEAMFGASYGGPGGLPHCKAMMKNVYNAIRDGSIPGVVLTSQVRDSEDDDLI